MDYVKGRLLMDRLLDENCMTKEKLFGWFGELAGELADYHRCGSGQCYRYLNPYSVVVTRDEHLLLLDLSAKSNEAVMKKMLMPSVREHFIRPAAGKWARSKLGIDIYSLGKTMQFLLAYTELSPELTLMEEIKLTRLIEKCLGENGKKMYESIGQIQKELPYIKKKRKIL